MRKIVGLGPNTTRISYKKILESQSFLKHKPEELKSYKTKVDVKGTLGKFKDEVAPGKLVKRVPGFGTAFSFLTNSAEFLVMIIRVSRYLRNLDVWQQGWEWMLE